MSNENLPLDSKGEGDPRLPARVEDARGLALASPHSVALDLLREDRGKDSEEIDLLAYWRILVKRRWLILSVLAGVVALSLLLTLMATPIYRATTVLKIDNNEQQIIQLGETTAASAGRDPEFLATQIGLLTSRTLAERVADDLQLDENALDRLNKPSWFERFKSVVRPAKSAKTEAEAGVKDAKAEESGRREAADFIAENLTAEPRRNSRLISVHFDSPDPKFSARAANALADGFIASELERKFGASSYAKTYLEEQLKLVKSRLEDSEKALVAFAQKENLVNTGEGQSLISQNLSELNAQLATAQAQRIRAQARWAEAQRASSLPQDMLTASLVPALRQQQADLRRQYQEKLQVFKPEYPEMQQLQGQISELDRQVAAEIASVRRSIKAEYDAASRQESLLTGQLSALRSQTLDTDSRSIQYNILKREVDTNRELYDGLLQRYKEVGVAGEVRPNNIAVIDRAEVPDSRFKPSVTLNLAIGLLSGVLLGVLLAFVLEFLDDTIKTPEDVEQHLRLAVLGIIPKLGTKQTVSTEAADLRSAFSEAYRSARTALQFSTDQGVPKVLLVTSTNSGEGKSTSSLALARNFAQLGKKVLLVEGDLRNPSLHRELGTKPSMGLSNLLSGAAALPDVVVDGGHANLKVIFAGPLPPNPAELLSGSRLVSLLSIAGQHYDQVVIDGPPVMGLADSPILANAADATLMVVNSGITKVKSAQLALKRLLVARAYIVGVLLTKYDARAVGEGYHYEGYYAYGNAPQLTKR